MKPCRSLTALLVLVVVTLPLAAQQYKVTGTIPIPGDWGWDYLVADGGNRLLYVSHGTQVELLDLDSGKIVGKIDGMTRIHGIALAHDLGRGFISDGGANEVVVFDLNSHQVLQKVKAGTNPDGIVYDPFTRRVFAFNGKSSDATAIDGATGKVLATLPVGGKPEFPVSDGKGNVFANVEDKNEIVHIDPQGLKVLAHWPVAPCEGPSGLAMDIASNRLFSVCDEKKMVVVDAGNGKVVATVAIGDGPDAARYDPDTRLVFSSNGAGTLTVIKQDGPDKYTVLQEVKTERSARTMALDPKTKKIYLPAATLGAPPAPTAEIPHPRPKPEPGTFHLVVVSPS